MDLQNRLTSGAPLLLDGATGTELNRRGVDTTLPLWSARALITAPRVLTEIHADYARAGADILTADTFRTNRRTLDRAGLASEAQTLTARAIALARAGAERGAPGRQIWVAGSLAPVEDCYTPELTPPDHELMAEHGEMAQALLRSGADLILVETMPTIREARIATQAARATGLPVLVGFTCRSDNRLFSGETVTEAARAILPLGPTALMINCTPSHTIRWPLSELRVAAPDLPLGAYANIGHTDDIVGWTDTGDVTPDQYAGLGLDWLGLGARLVGGCCGTRPAHIAAMRAALDRAPGIGLSST